MSLVVVTPPASEPVTLTEAKAQLRIPVAQTEQDDHITGLIKSAREHCESYHGHAYITQTLKLVLDGWPDDDEILLPRPPYQSITSVKYVDTSGVQQTLDAAAYQADLTSTPGRIRPAYGYSWPTIRDQMAAIEIIFVAGFGDADDVPERIRQAIKIKVADLFENPESMGAGTVAYTILGATAEALLCGDRVEIDE